MSYVLHLIIFLAVYSIVAMTLNVVVGYCGYLNLAHAGFFAIGAYTYAIANTVYGLTFVPSALIGMALGSAFSILLALAAWRLRGDVFVLASLAIQALLFSSLHNWAKADAELGSWSNLTNGPLGIAGASQPVLFGFHVDSLPAIAVLSVALAAMCGFVFWLLVSSPWGRLLKAMRDDELALRGLGKSSRGAKVQAFAISCGFVALAGVLYSSYMSYVDPSVASLDASILMLCMLLVGGTGNFRGPVVGAAVLLAIPEALRFFQIPDTVAANVRLAIYGLLLVVIMHVRPQGLAGDYRIE